MPRISNFVGAVEQSTTMVMDMAGEEEGRSSATMHSDFNEKELEVSQILLNLGEIIAESESISLKKQQQELELLRSRRLQPFTVVWGAKKILAGNMRRFPGTPSSGTGGIPAIMATPIRQVKPAQAASPDTPLNFSPSSESDDISPAPSQPHKRRRDELMQSVEELSECRKLLRKEVDSVRSYHHKLLAFNKKLKEKKQMVSATSTSHETEGISNLEIEKNLGGRAGQRFPSSTAAAAAAAAAAIPQSQLVNPMAMESYPQQQWNLHCPSPTPAVLGQVGPPMLASNVVLGGDNQVGSPCQPLDYAEASSGESRARVVARAAEARRRRKLMINQQKLELKLKSNSKCGFGTGPMRIMPVLKKT